jgi:medium-chain acyl-[acyl-carrier-protein] hydrolase
MYRGWDQYLAENVEVCAVSLPGREMLLRERPVPDLHRLAEEVARQIRPDLDRPFALFGHSMGSWLAFEVARALRRSGAPFPFRLFVSGRRAPQLPARDPAMHDLDDGQLIAEIQRRYGGIPQTVLREPDLLALLLPALRADLTALETYQYRDEAPLGCAISCFGGIADAHVPRDDLEPWRLLTAGAFELMQFPGAHFYLQESSRKALLEAIDRTLRLADPRVGLA